MPDWTRFKGLPGLLGIRKNAGVITMEFGDPAINATISAFIQTLLDDADAATARTTLGALAAASPTTTGTLTTAILSVQGNMRFGRTARTASFSLTTSTFPLNPCDATSGAIVVTNVATTTVGIVYMVMKTDTSQNAVSLTGTFNGVTGIVLQNRGDYVIFSTTASSGAFEVIASNRTGPAVRSSSAASTASLAIDVSSTDQYNLTAQAAALTIAAPTGSPVEGQPLRIRLKDNGTARAITFNAIFRPMGVALPTTTVIGKYTYMDFVYNRTDARWDLIRVNQEA